tara:strand:- start:14392 stop:14769 length:378 start_codon:yes stop_codon:yes gene_type:complete
MPIAKANFSHITDIEHGYPEYSIFLVDFISAMNAETGDPDTSSTTAGLEIVRRTIEQFANITAEGPLVDSNTQKTYILRADTAPTAASLQTAIRALNGNGQISATISSATVTASKLGILTAAAVS